MKIKTYKSRYKRSDLRANGIHLLVLNKVYVSEITFYWRCSGLPYLTISAIHSLISKRFRAV